METPLEQKNKELVEENSKLLSEIRTSENSLERIKLDIENLEKDISTTEETKKQKLGELAAVEVDLANAIESATKQKKTAIDASVVEAEKVTALQEKKKTLEDEVAALTQAAEGAAKVKSANEDALSRAQDAHKAFMEHAASEKARIVAELKELDEAAQAQVVVIEAQIATQTSLDAEISTKKGVVVELDTDIETKTERLSTVTVELQNLEETHKNRMKATGEEFDTFVTETDAAKKKAAEELAVVEADLEAKNAQAVAWVGREEEMNQREQFLKERYKKAGIPW